MNHVDTSPQYVARLMQDATAKIPPEELQAAIKESAPVATGDAPAEPVADTGTGLVLAEEASSIRSMSYRQLLEKVTDKLSTEYFEKGLNSKEAKAMCDDWGAYLEHKYGASSGVTLSAGLLGNALISTAFVVGRRLKPLLQRRKAKKVAPSDRQNAQSATGGSTETQETKNKPPRYPNE